MQKGKLSESTEQKKACDEVPPPQQLAMLVKKIQVVIKL